MDGIHPGFPGPAGGLTETPDDFQDFFLRHGPASPLKIWVIRDERRRQGLPAS